MEQTVESVARNICCCACCKELDRRDVDARWPVAGDLGNFQIGLQTGAIDGRERPDGSVLFSFEGMDEMDEMRGAGTATVEDDRLTLTLMYHQGDDYTFEATRET